MKTALCDKVNNHQHTDTAANRVRLLWFVLIGRAKSPCINPLTAGVCGYLGYFLLAIYLINIVAERFYGFVFASSASGAAES